MKRTFLYILLILLQFNVQAQSSCSNAKEVKSGLQILKSGWYQFTSEGAKAKFLLTSTSNQKVEYTIYEQPDNCRDIDSGNVKIVVSTKASESLTDAIYNEAVKSGRCICDVCLKDFISTDSILNLVQDQKYLIHIELKSGQAKLDLSFSEIEVKKENSFTLDQNIDEIDVGYVYVFKEVRFIASQAAFLQKSFPELEALFAFLERNPNVKIQINGHVNGPGSPNTEYYQSLSQDRAHAVQMYLMEKGIKGFRMQTKGFGNTMMIYSSPKNPAEAEANRRVEIVITSK